MPSRSGSAIPSAMHVVDAGHDVAVVDAAAVADHGLRERVPATDAPARVRAADTRSPPTPAAPRSARSRRSTRPSSTWVRRARTRSSGSGPSAPCGRHQQTPSISTSPSPIQRMVRTSGKTRPSTMWSLNDVRRDQVVRLVIEPRELRRDAVCLMRGPDVGGVGSDRARRRGDASPMNASSRHRSSRRPSSQTRPQALPVPSVLAYQSESSSHHEARPDRLQVGPRIGRARPSRGRSSRRLPDEQAVVARVPLDDRDRVPRRARARAPPSATPARTAVAAVRAARSRRATVAPVPTRARVIARHDRDDDVVAVPVDLPHAQIGRADLGRGSPGRGRSGTAGAARRRAGERSDRAPARRRCTARALQSRPYEPGSAARTSSRAPSPDQATLSPTRRASRPASARRRPRASCTGAGGRRVIRSDRNASREPSGDHTGA